MAATLPKPVYYAGSIPTTWGSAAYGGQHYGTIKQLISWGDSAPDGLRLSPVERLAYTYWGGFVELDDGKTVSMALPATKARDGSWGNTNGDGTWHGKAISWATDPAMVMATAKGITPFVVKYNSIPDGQTPAPAYDAVSNAINIIAWGIHVPPGARLTKIECDAIRGSGWLKVGGKKGTYVIELSDPRFVKHSDGQWWNRNHPTDPLGIAIAAADKPEHGVAGLIDAFVTDVENDPLGAILLIIVLVSAAPALPIILGALETVATVAVVGAAGIDAYSEVTTGHSAGALGAVGDAAYTIATSPAEVGRVLAGAEVAIAGAALGIKGAGALGAALAGSAFASDTGKEDNPDAPAKRKYWWDAFSRK